MGKKVMNHSTTTNDGLIKIERKRTCSLGNDI